MIIICIMIVGMVIDSKLVNNVTIGFKPLAFVNAGCPSLWCNEDLVLGLINGIRSQWRLKTSRAN